MTAILNEIRDLDARMRRGELSASEYAAERAALLHNVEEAQTEFTDVPGPTPAPRRQWRKTGSSALGFSLVVCLIVMGLCISLTLLFLPDLNLALTLGVTILAALCIALLQEKEEE
jgi:hypothetical protein